MQALNTCRSPFYLRYNRASDSHRKLQDLFTRAQWSEAKFEHIPLGNSSPAALVKPAVQRGEK
jgi:hypothetical protein